MDIRAWDSWPRTCTGKRVGTASRRSGCLRMVCTLPSNPIMNSSNVPLQRICLIVERTLSEPGSICTEELLSKGERQGQGKWNLCCGVSVCTRAEITIYHTTFQLYAVCRGIWTPVTLQHAGVRRTAGDAKAVESATVSHWNFTKVTPGIVLTDFTANRFGDDPGWRLKAAWAWEGRLKGVKAACLDLRILCSGFALALRSQSTFSCSILP